MKNALGWTILGVAVGILVTSVWRPWETAPTTPITASEPQTGSTFSRTTSTAASDDVERLARRLADVESVLGELSEQVAALNSEADAAEAFASALQQQAESPEGRARAASMRAFLASRGTGTGVLVGDLPGSESLADRLVEGGFTRSRAEEIKRRADELAMSAIEARYEAQRNGTDPAALPSPGLVPGPNSMLRQELGDIEYEQYLIALGQDVAVSVIRVVGDSPAARAGLQPGDQIVSYAGKRVFDLSEVTPLTAQGTPGESVVMEILRNDEPMQVIVPRGPLGISLTPPGMSIRMQ